MLLDFAHSDKMQSLASVFLWLPSLRKMADLPPEFSFGLADNRQLILLAGWTRR